jgi:ABC-2 type transport system permease protein
MDDDVMTIMRKDLKELYKGGGHGNIGRLSLIITALIGIPMAPAILLGSSGVMLPMFALFFLPTIASTAILDTVVGERERHTLETLLASRLPDRAILLGKLGAASLFAWFHLAAIMLPGVLLALAVAPWRPELIAAPFLWFALVAGGPLLCVIAASVSVAIAVRARSVRAAVTLVTIVLLVVEALLFAVMFAVMLLTALVLRGPALLDDAGTTSPLPASIAADATSLGPVVMATLVIAALAVITFAIADARFRRPNLMLD